MTLSWLVAVIRLPIILLSLHHHQDELVIGSNQDLVFLSLETHKGELVVPVQVEDSVTGLSH